MSSLRGKTLAITRAEKDAGEFIRLVERLGGTAIALPTIEIIPKPNAVGEFLDRLRLTKYDYCAFMSARTVRVIEPRADEIVAALGQTRVIAVGPKTAAALKHIGLKVEITPENFSSKGVIEILSVANPRGRKIIIPRSAAAKRDAADSLRALGMQVDEVMLYDVRQASPSSEWEPFTLRLASGKIDALIFTSASSVTSFFKILGSLSPGLPSIDKLTRVISIGPMTSSELHKRGVSYAEAGRHTVRNTVELAASLQN